MICKVIRLCDHFKNKLIGKNATLTVYGRDNSPEIDSERRYPAVLICPGGGYEFTSDREAEPVALAFLNRGYTTAVLRYSVVPIRYPAQLIEVAAAMMLLRRRKDWYIDTEKIAVCGFSAGGHLAASLGVFWNDPVITDELRPGEHENRPDAMILSYPVISAGPNAHRGSFNNLLGKNPDPALLPKLSLENAVSQETVPAFIWHTADDKTVPVENAFLMAAALKKASVPFELHIYQNGVHGLSLCDSSTAAPDAHAFVNPHTATWLGLADEWLKGIWGS